MALDGVKWQNRIHVANPNWLGLSLLKGDKY